MKRFMGMMPSDEVKIRKRFDTGDGMTARIDAGPNGWTVTYADYSTRFEDKEDSSENNFAAALGVLKGSLDRVEEILLKERFDVKV